MDFIDLHVHSSCSDGTLSPAQVTSLAAQKGLRAIALTDHDTVSGISEALEAGKKLGVEIIPGIEFSTSCQNRDVHIVGLHINPCDAYFLEALKEFQSSRDRDVYKRQLLSLLSVLWHREVLPENSRLPDVPDH